MELITQLVENLGISEGQAKGGAGLLFNLAKEKLASGDFSQISEAVPGINEMMEAAPQSGGFAKAVGSITSAFGGKAGKLGSLAGIASGFSKLDLDSDMLGKFLPVILSFVQSKGGDSLKNILSGVLK